MRVDGGKEKGSKFSLRSIHHRNAKYAGGRSRRFQSIQKGAQYVLLLLHARQQTQFTILHIVKSKTKCGQAFVIWRIPHKNQNVVGDFDRLFRKPRKEKEAEESGGD